MVILDGMSELPGNVSTRVVIGKFDGIHLGHQRLIHEITDEKKDLAAVVFTFTRNSGYFSENKRIYDDTERRRRFEELGVDYLVEYELNDTTSKEEPEDFARNVLKGRLHAMEVVCGNDLSFGYKGRGNVELLKRMEPELGIKVRVIEKVKYQGEDISSSRIRTAMENGDVENANKMLGN